MNARPIKVLIVDDSALIRQLLTTIINADPRLTVVGTASDPYKGREKIKALNPDVLTLDVEMPAMDGLTFLENLMRLHPMPVLMVSALTEKGADAAIHALELGAFDFVTKPKIGISEGLEELAETICTKLVAAAQCGPATPRVPLARPRPQAERAGGARYKTTDKLVAIGASTGGTEAIKALVTELPADTPAIVVTQHIPPLFSRSFAERLDRLGAMRACEAGDGQPVLGGHIYVAPGGRHLLVRKDGARWRCRLSDAPPVNRHRPSVDVMFDSVQTACGHNAMGIVLTGMGDDGARGLAQMRAAGARTVAQDEASSVVWGMPGACVRHDAAERILNLDEIAAAIGAYARS